MGSWRTLLLDSGYQPIKIISWMRAVELLLSGKAEVVEEYEDIPIRSARLTLQLPSVLKLVKSFKRRKQKVKFSRYNVFYRDNWTCQYCGEKKKTEELTFDHVIPRSRKTPESGKSWENIVTACWRCNHKKGSQTPEEAGLRLLHRPGKPTWTPQLVLRLKGNEPESWLSYMYWHMPLEET
jgi:5-methylcytosine-specific restriction endonuclease McrA